MWAWHCTELTGVAGLRYVESADLKPSGRQVRVAIAAAGLNFLDTLMLRGQYQVKPPLPFIPGVEFCGTVIERGSDAQIAIGSRVMGTASVGAFATEILSDERVLLPAPPDVPSAQLAVTPIVYPTAYLALHEQGQLRAGEIVLITAAAGGVGIAALQLAKAAGATVIAAASASKHEALRKLGADMTVDYADAGWSKTLHAALKVQGKSGVDLVIDMVGGDVGLAAVRLLGWSGRLMIVGFASGEILNIPANLLLLKQARAEGVYWGGLVDRDAKAAFRIAGQLFGLMREQQIEPYVSRTAPMAQLPELLDDLAQRRSIGKLVVSNEL